METLYDGYISKYVNKKMSEPMARLLVKTKVTPNQISVSSASGVSNDNTV